MATQSWHYMASDSVKGSSLSCSMFLWNMTAISNQLVLVGGEEQGEAVINWVCGELTVTYPCCCCLQEMVGGHLGQAIIC